MSDPRYTFKRNVLRGRIEGIAECIVIADGCYDLALFKALARARIAELKEAQVELDLAKSEDGRRGDQQPSNRNEPGSVREGSKTGAAGDDSIPPAK